MIDATSTKVKIEYNAAGWSDFQNRTFVRAVVVKGSIGVEVVETGERRYCLTITEDGKSIDEAGLEAEDRVKVGLKLAGNAILGLVSKPILEIIDATKKTNCNVVLHDLSPMDLLSTVWWAGSTFSVHFDKRIGCHESYGSFREGIRQVAESCKSIKKIQFWCHGGSQGKVFCGNELISFGLNGERDDFEPLMGKVNGATIWFRSCSTLASGDDDRGLPGEKGTEIADHLISKYGFRIVAGHTATIKFMQECLYARYQGSWYGPKASGVTQDAEIEDFFDFSREDPVA
jgi:hypothetical protein